MQIETLKVFCDVVQSRSFSKAATLNFVSQSAVSQQIRGLEQRFGHRLIERGKKNLRPTPAGQILYEVAQDVLSRLDEMEARLQALSKSVGGTVRVATIYSAGLHELQSYLGRFLMEYPAAHVKVEYNRANRIYEEVVTNAVDVGIVAYPARRSGIEIIPFIEENMVLVCHPDHPFAKSKRIDISKLAGQRFIAFERDIPTRRAVTRFLRSHRVRVRIVMEFDNIETSKRAIEIGAGISILPRNTIRREEDLGTLRGVGFLRERLSRPLGILVKKGRSLPPAVQRFIDVLMSEENLCEKPAPGAKPPRARRGAS